MRKNWKIGVLFCYMFILLSVTLLSREKSSQAVNLEILRTYRRPNWQNYANIITFIPLGFLLSLISFRFLWIGVAFSCFIEVSQFLFQRGELDIDDIVSNSIGITIGICIYVLLLLIARIVRAINTDSEKQ